ncbi:hypothetical protein ZWY2020_060109 [Hordeum vulgare]|nr:hypothetical protein ZWY2020_060109 [Hordeum vulgare]
MYSGSVSALQVVESCLVTPSNETPREGLWLSALDLVLANRGHTPLVHVYSASDVAAANGFFNVAKLKKSMAKALVPFYPLAGRLGADRDGRNEIDCNGEGALRGSPLGSHRRGLQRPHAVVGVDEAVLSLRSAVVHHVGRTGHLLEVRRCGLSDGCAPRRGGRRPRGPC